MELLKNGKRIDTVELAAGDIWLDSTEVGRRETNVALKGGYHLVLVERY